MGTHAFLSASGAAAWTRCAAKPFREIGLPDKSSPAAIEGTAAHILLDECVRYGYKPESKIGTDVRDEDGKNPVEVTQEMCDAINQTLDLVKDIPGLIYAEKKLDISNVTGEKYATGTADIIVVDYVNGKITIIDFKYGFDQIDVLENEQLMVYAAAAIEKYDLTGDITEVTLIISQPRIAHTDIWNLEVTELNEHIKKINVKGKHILIKVENGKGHELEATPGEKQCHFCKLGATCEERRTFHLSTITDDYVDLYRENDLLRKVKNAEMRISASDDTHLATCYEAVDLIENWCKAVKKEVTDRVLSGAFTDKRYKAVLGRAGNRKISDEKELMKLAKDYYAIDDNQLFEKSMFSVAQLEKLHKNTKFWKDVQRLITREEPKITIAHCTDKREEISIVSDFINLDTEEDIEAKLGLSIENKP